MIKFALLLTRATRMLVGSSVGSWSFTLGALRGLMPILTTYVAAPTEHHSRAKLHWHVIPVGLLNGYRNGYRSFTDTFVTLVSSGKRQTNLFSHLHG